MSFLPRLCLQTPRLTRILECIRIKGPPASVRVDYQHDLEGKKPFLPFDCLIIWIFFGFLLC